MRKLLLSVPLLLSLSACTPRAWDVAAETTTASTIAYETARAHVAKGEGDALAHCLSDAVPPKESPACVTAEIKRWAPLRAAVLTLYGVLLGAREVLAVTQARATMGAEPDVEDLVRVVVALGDAVDAVRKAAP